MTKKINILLIVVLLMGFIFQPIATFGQGEDDQNDPIVVQPDPVFTRPEPNIVIGRNYRVPVLKAGTEIRLSIPIENTNAGQAKDLYVSPVIGDIDEFPFEIDQMVPRRRISEITGRNHELAVFNFKVPANVEPGTYPLRFNVEYTSSNGGSFSTSETIYVQIENDKQRPNLRLNFVEVDQGKLMAGQMQAVRLTIENTGDLKAQNIEVRLSGLGANGLRLATPIDIREIKQLDGKAKEEVFFNIVTSDDIEDGNYTADLTVKYKDEYNKSYETQSKVQLAVVGKAGAETNFSLTNMTYPQNGVDPYTDFVVSFDLKNTGGEAAQNVKVSVIGGEGILPKSMPIKNIGELAAGRQQTIAFTLFAREGIEAKNYPIQITVEYEIGSGRTREVKTFEQYVGVFVQGQKSSTGVPKIIVDQYDYYGEYVKAGEPFDLMVSFFNTNHEKTVKNIRVSLSSTGDVFSPVGGSNSFFISEINSQGRVTKNISLRSKVDADYDTHNLFVDIEYEDDQGQVYNVKEMVGIPVVQDVTLMIDEVMSSPENFVGSPTALSVEFYNTGRALIRNLIIRTEGDLDISEGSLYIGNLEPGNNNYYDVTVTPRELGTTTGRIIFEYDDEIDRHYVVEKAFTIEVMEPMQMYPPDDFGGFDDFNEQSTNWRSRILIGGAILLLAIGGFIWRRRKRRRAEAEEVEAYE